MNEKCSEKTTLQKVMDIIAGIALCVWGIFEALERTNKVQSAGLVTRIAMGVVCVCEAFPYWNKKTYILLYCYCRGSLFNSGYSIANNVDYIVII